MDVKVRFQFSMAVVALLLAIAIPGAAADSGREPGGGRESKPSDDFPEELVRWIPNRANPVFAARQAGDWAERIRERGWILREGGCYHLWFTGYDGTREGIKQLGYATSRDGLRWTPSKHNPLSGDHWVEDMMVVRCGRIYYMFAEGADRNHAVMLTSRDCVRWSWQGPLDVRLADGVKRPEDPCGTPTVLCCDGRWYLFYERLDRGIWLATTNDLDSRRWTNVQDNPVLSPGPRDYDRERIALNQVIRRGGEFYAFYHGTGDGRNWNTNIARSSDLLHWEKHGENPIIDGNRSSGIVVESGQGLRLYTMHDQIEVFDSVPRVETADRNDR